MIIIQVFECLVVKNKERCTKKGKKTEALDSVDVRIWQSRFRARIERSICACSSAKATRTLKCFNFTRKMKMLFKGHSTRLEMLIEKIHSNKESSCQGEFETIWIKIISFAYKSFSHKYKFRFWEYFIWCSPNKLWQLTFWLS